MKINLFIISLLFSFYSLLAQQGLPTYQDYLTAGWFLNHPSMAGAAHHNRIRPTGRTQWVGVENAPSLFTASINGRVRKNVGVGALVFSDKNGNFSNNSAYGTFAYHLNFSRRETELNQFSFAISTGISERVLDQTSFSNSLVASDSSINPTTDTDRIISLNLSATYLNRNLFMMFTTKNLSTFFKNALNFVEPENLRNYTVAMGNGFSLGRRSKTQIEPSVQYSYTPNTNEQLLDINTKVYFDMPKGVLTWGGVSYRRGIDYINYVTDDEDLIPSNFNSISTFLGIHYNDFVFAYTFTNQIGISGISNSGFHQVTLGYNFGKDSRPYRGSSRWSCNCPVGKL